MKRLVVIGILFVCICSWCPTAALAQTEQQGIAILKEAKELRDKARSREDLEKAVMKYEKALGIFERVRAEKWKGITLNNIGLIYANLGRYLKALGYYEILTAVSRDTLGADSVTATISGAASPDTLEQAHAGLASSRSPSTFFPPYHAFPIDCPAISHRNHALSTLVTPCPGFMSWAGSTSAT